MPNLFRILLVCSGATLLSACDTMQSAFEPAPDLSEPTTITGSLSAAPTTVAEHNAMGREKLRVGLYGLAEEHFRKSIEITPHNPDAWLGLAASYDNLRRFDLADRAYKQIRKLLGPTSAVLNNEGYSYMMRGNFKKARALFTKAHQLDPNNATVNRNLAHIEQVQALHLPPVE